MIEIEQGSFAAMTADNHSREISTADSTVIGLILQNDGTDDAYVQVRYHLSDGQQHVESVPAGAQSQQWALWTVGALAAGNYQCSVVVTSEPGGDVLEEDVTSFEVADAYQHNPGDYRLEVGQIVMRTEGGTIVHTEDEAFATERVFYDAEVRNTSHQFLGPVEVHFLVDGAPVGWGGMSYSGVAGGESFWAQGYSDPLPVGNHTLAIRVESSDPSLFVGSEQTSALTVLPSRSRGSVHEGAEDELPGWTARDLNIFVKNYLGSGVDGNVYVEINGGGHRVARSGVIENGVVNISGTVYAPTNEGSLVLTVDTADGRRLTGGGTFDDGEHAITKTYVESKRKETHTFSTEEQWQAMVGATVSAGQDFKVFKWGVEVRGEYTWGETITKGVEYEVWIALNNLEDEERESAGQR